MTDGKWNSRSTKQIALAYLSRIRAVLLNRNAHMNHVGISLKFSKSGEGTRFCISATWSSEVPTDPPDSLFLLPISHIYCASSQVLAGSPPHLEPYIRGSHRSGHKHDQMSRIQKLLESFLSEAVEARCCLMYKLFSELCSQPLAYPCHLSTSIRAMAIVASVVSFSWDPTECRTSWR